VYPQKEKKKDAKKDIILIRLKDAKVYLYNAGLS